MKNKGTTVKSLIMCTTPLQIIIAERIIKLNPNQSFDLLFVTNHYNEKFQLYYDRLKRICVDTYYYQAANGIKSYGDVIVRFSKLLKQKSLNKNYENLYLASIDSLYFQYMVSVNPKSKIFTFDDGAANIVEFSIYKNRPRKKCIKNLIARLLGIKYDMAAIKHKSELHYTIYNNIPNIIENTQFIMLFDEDSNITFNSNSRVKKIFLGQPLGEISKTLEDLDISKLLNVLNIDYYFPHPREQLKDLKNVEVIHSNLIIEDFIVKYLRKNPDVEIDIYSFISTANLNVANIGRVNSRFIYNSLIYKRHESFYSLAEQKFNIPVIQLE